MRDSGRDPFDIAKMNVRAGSIRELRNFNQSAKPAHSPRPTTQNPKQQPPPAPQR